MASGADVAPEADILYENVYEQQRLARIAKNKEKLEQLGIVSAWQKCADQLPVNDKRKLQQLKQPRPAKAKAAGHAVENIRRSARLRGEVAAILPEEEDKLLAEKSTVPKRGPCRGTRIVLSPKRLLAHGSDTVALYRHNVMRLQSMSDNAMQKRIQKISRVDKMESLIEVLEDAGRLTLLQEAKEALAQLFES